MVQHQLTSIAKVEPEYHKKTMTVGFSLWCNVLIFVVSAGAPLAGFICFPFFRAAFDPNSMFSRQTALSVALLAGLFFILGMAYLIFMMFTFPEWPINRLLVRRFRNKLKLRPNSLISPNDPDARILEVIPRENWNQLKLETATDVVLMKIVDNTIFMEGDCFRYRIPASAIANCKVESLRPPGWWVDHYVLVMALRTPNGFRECPLSLRDFSLGSLGPTARKIQTEELAARIQTISKDYYEPVRFDHDDDDEDDYEDEEIVSANVVRSDNPYAAPTRNRRPR